MLFLYLMLERVFFFFTFGHYWGGHFLICLCALILVCLKGKFGYTLWQTGDIGETAKLTSLYCLVPVCLDSPYEWLQKQQYQFWRRRCFQVRRAGKTDATLVRLQGATKNRILWSPDRMQTHVSLHCADDSRWHTLIYTFYTGSGCDQGKCAVVGDVEVLLYVFPGSAIAK